MMQRAATPTVLAGAALALGAVLWAAPSPAAAQSISVKLKLSPPPEPSDKIQLPQPTFRAVIEGAAEGLAEDKFTLRQELPEGPVSVKADKVKTFKDTEEPMFMVVLVQGDTRWMGNESYFVEGEDEFETRREGAFSGAEKAVNALAETGPPATAQAALLTYGGGKPVTKLAMSPIASLSGALGKQKEYTENTLSFLIGLDEAANVLGGVQGRRILVVMGDGTDQGENVAEGLKERLDRLKGLQVEVYAIYHEPIKSEDSPGEGNMRALGKLGDFRKAELRDNFATIAESFANKINAVYYVTFPSCTAATPPVCIKHDGKEYDFVVLVSEQDTDPIALTTLKWDPPAPPQEGSLWWLWLLLGLVVVTVVAVVVVKMSRREQIVQPPMPEPIEMPPAPPPAPAKTMMIGVGSQEGGMPVVGWIVPLSGPNQYQTFKLLQGATKIGSGGSSDIVIGDQFMSTEHCEIHMSPIGFTLKDGGSTNGTYVNDGRVNTHELVDNDMITMGKTSFKFKSIN